MARKFCQRKHGRRGTGDEHSIMAAPSLPAASDVPDDPRAHRQHAGRAPTRNPRRH
jgi:hypothetical protein